ncbi:MAG: ATPase [Fusobacteriia bacterium 4572_132]|nr:MAG: ATPase [Fusobacteriia bacterium 4572_132]
MKIAVLSGKGGTGKTTVSSNLSISLKNSVILDCDVEEPNSHIFLKPDITETISIKTEYPEVDADKCNLCGKCGDFCNFNAIIPTKKNVLVFAETCHACGGCQLVCPTNAIEYQKREIGKIYTGKTIYGNTLSYGELNLGEMSGIGIIEGLFEGAKDEELVIVDAPPGTACSTVAAVENVDYAIIVTEPTPFGVSDMKMVVEMLREMKIPFGLIINKAGLGDNEIYEYSEEENIEILMEIPFEEEIAKLYSEGIPFSTKKPEYKEEFINVYENIKSKF